MGSTLRVVHTLSVGERPLSVVIDPDGRYAYVTNSAAGTLTRIDLYRFLVDTETLEVGHGPSGVALGPDGRTAYTASSLDNTVSVIDTQAFKVTSVLTTDPSPQGVAFNPEAGEFYVAARDGDTLTAYESENLLPKASVSLGEGQAPFAIKVVPDGTLVLVSNLGSGSVLMLNADHLTEAGFVSVGALPHSIEVDPEGIHAYVAVTDENTVARIHLPTGMLVGQLDVGEEPYGIAMHPQGDRAYVTLRGEDSVAEIRLDNFVLSGPGVAVGRKPSGVALTPEGSHIVALNVEDNSVSILSEAPLVSILKTEPEAIGTHPDHSSSVITWKSDGSGSYQVEIGGKGIQGSGVLLETGTVEPGTDMAFTVHAEDLTEGDGGYYVFVYVNSQEPVLIGRIAAWLLLDSEPPSIPENVRISTGDTFLRVSWDPSSDAISGIAGYRIRFGTVPDQLDETVNTQDVHQFDLAGLAPGITYYLTVSAMDKAGNESDPSPVSSGMPESIPGTVSSGGCFINTLERTAGRAIWVLWILLTLVCLLGTRFGKRFIPLGIFGIVILCAEAPAREVDWRNITGIRMGLKAGYYLPTSGRVEKTYEEGGFGGALMVTWLNPSNFETTAGLGLMVLNAEALTVSDRGSGLNSDLFIVPLEFTLRYRFQFSEDQLLTPYVDGGIQGVYYREEIKGIHKDASGLTGGYHGSVGLRLLLDRILKEDALTFHRAFGSKKTFLFVEGRYAVIDGFGTKDFNLGGVLLTMGVDVEF